MEAVWMIVGAGVAGVAFVAFAMCRSAAGARNAAIRSLTRAWEERQHDRDERVVGAMVRAMDAGATLADLEQACQ